jgi:hypothetical protein
VKLPATRAPVGVAGAPAAAPAAAPPTAAAEDRELQEALALPAAPAAGSSTEVAAPQTHAAAVPAQLAAAAAPAHICLTLPAGGTARGIGARLVVNPASGALVVAALDPKGAAALAGVGVGDSLSALTQSGAPVQWGGCVAGAEGAICETLAKAFQSEREMKFTFQPKQDRK